VTATATNGLWSGPTEGEDPSGEQGLDPNAIPLDFYSGLVEGHLHVGFDGHCRAGPESSVVETSETITVTVTCSDGAPPVTGDPSATRIGVTLAAPIGDRVVVDGARGERLTEAGELDPDPETGPTQTTP